MDWILSSYEFIICESLLITMSVDSKWRLPDIFCVVCWMDGGITLNLPRGNGWISYSCLQTSFEMPFVQRVVEPKFLSRTSLRDENGKPRVTDEELQAVTNCTLSNALRQLASLVLLAEDIFSELTSQLEGITERSKVARTKIESIHNIVEKYDPKKVTVRKYFILVILLALSSIFFLLLYRLSAMQFFRYIYSHTLKRNHKLVKYLFNK